MHRLAICFTIHCVFNKLSVLGISEQDIRTNYAKSRASLAKSTWPSDHADVSRSKFTLGAGLPSGFDPADLKIATQTSLPMVQWIYTAGEDSEFLYVFGGPVISGCYVAKLDARTLEVLSSFKLPSALYIGGLLIHENGNVYCVQANRLYVFWSGDLTNSSVITIPYTDLNGNLIQTNGMLVTQDGYLVVKQWSYTLEDVLLFVSAREKLGRLLVAMIVVISTVVYFLPSGVVGENKTGVRSHVVSNLIRSLLIGSIIGCILWVSCILSGSYQIIAVFLTSYPLLIFSTLPGLDLHGLLPLSPRYLRRLRLPRWDSSG